MRFFSWYWKALLLILQNLVSDDSKELNLQTRTFTLKQIKAATNDFDPTYKIGEGGFGSVFRGTIRSTDDPHKKIDIAVKQLSRRGLQVYAISELDTFNSCHFLSSNVSIAYLL